MPGWCRSAPRSCSKRVVPDLTDPFNVADLSEAALLADPARLADEAAAISMMGGRRVVRVRGAGNDLAELFESLSGRSAQGDALVVVEAGDLAKTARLAQAVRRADKTPPPFPAIPTRARDLADVVRDALRAEGLSIAPDALDDAVSRLGSDRGVTRREIEKLALYAHGRKQVTLEDVRAVMGDEAEARSESACDAAGSGDLARLDRELERLWVVRHPAGPGAAQRHGPFPAAAAGARKRRARREHRCRDEAAAPAGAFLPRHAFKAQAQRWNSDTAGRGAGHAAGSRSA